MSEELKPCPFCGGKAYIGKIFETICDKDNLITFEVGCEDCKILFRRCRDTQKEAKKRAIEAWNRRAEK